MTIRCTSCGTEGVTDSLRGMCPACLFRKTIGDEDPILSGGTFASLEVLSRLGQGGMGVVYKARQPKLDRIVALKILSPSLAMDAEFRERFIQEAQVLARMDHPNIVSVFDFGEDDGIHFIVMEYVEGTTLRSVLETGMMKHDELLPLVPALCEALEYAHARGVVHRDIKPENILVDRHGRVKIADFGIAKIAQPARKITQAGGVVGTLEYMPPEQFEAPQDVDHRADLYSLGAIIYEILTGRVPSSNFVRPSRISRTNPRFDRVLERALQREPGGRYQTARELNQAVTGVLSERPRPRRPWVAIAAAILLLGTLLGAWRLAGRWQDPQPEALVALIEKARSCPIADREKVIAELAGFLAGQPALEPRVREVRSNEKDPEVMWRLDRALREYGFLRWGKARLAVRNIRPVHPGGWSSELLLSPDGKLVATYGVDGRLVLLEAAELKERGVLMTTGPGARGMALAFDHAGKRLAVGTGKSVTMYDLATTGRLASFECEVDVWALCFTRDDAGLFTGSKEGLELRDPAKGTVNRRILKGEINCITLNPKGTVLAAQTVGGSLHRVRTADWSTTALSEDGGRGTVGSVRNLAFNGDGTLLAQNRTDSFQSGWTNELIIWDIEAGARSSSVSLGASCNNLAISPDRKLLGAYEEKADGIRLYSWKAVGSEEFGPAVAFWDFLITDEGHALSSHQGDFRRTDIRTGKVVARAMPHHGLIRATTFHPDGKSLVTLGSDGMLRQWSLAGGEEMGAFPSTVDVGGGSERLEISPDGALLGVSRFGGPMNVLDLKERKVIRTIDRNDSDPEAMAYGRNICQARLTTDRRAVLTYGDAVLRVVDVDHGTVLHEWKGDLKQYEGHGLSPDGRWGLRMSRHREVELRDLVSWKSRFTVKDPVAETTPYCSEGWATMDGKNVLYARSPREIRLIDGQTGVEIATRAFESNLVRILPDTQQRYWVLFLEHSVRLIHSETLRDVLQIETKEFEDGRWTAAGDRLVLLGGDTLRVYDLEVLRP